MVARKMFSSAKHDLGGDHTKFSRTRAGRKLMSDPRVKKILNEPRERRDFLKVLKDTAEAHKGKVTEKTFAQAVAALEYETGDSISKGEGRDLVEAFEDMGINMRGATHAGARKARSSWRELSDTRPKVEPKRSAPLLNVKSGIGFSKRGSSGASHAGVQKGMKTDMSSMEAKGSPRGVGKENFFWKNAA